MTPAALLDFLRSHRFAVQASVAPSQAPQAAVVGVAVTERFEIIFDMLISTRKAENLSYNPRIALVFGTGGDERTAQVEGIADLPAGAELERIKAVYYAKFPEGPERLSWPGLVYARVRPTWIRYSDFGQDPALIVEFKGEDLGVEPTGAPDLRAAYEAANYRIADYPHDFVMHIGEVSQPLLALLWDYSLSSAIFITAYNPYSQPRPERENREAQALLKKRLEELHAVAILDGEGSEPDGSWREPGFLALGLSREQGRQLMAEFQQNAIVHLQAGMAPMLVLSDSGAAVKAMQDKKLKADVPREKKDREF